MSEGVRGPRLRNKVRKTSGAFGPTRLFTFVSQYGPQTPSGRNFEFGIRTVPGDGQLQLNPNVDV